jgi:hypothetical protein
MSMLRISIRRCSTITRVEGGSGGVNARILELEQDLMKAQNVLAAVHRRAEEQLKQFEKDLTALNYRVDRLIRLERQHDAERERALTARMKRWWDNVE